MTISLAADRVSAISNPYNIDGRVSWHARDERGLGFMHVYLLRDGSDVVIVDTGLGVHLAPIIASLAAATGPGDRMSVLLLRQQEFDSICNLLPIVDRFPIRTIYGQHPHPLQWADFRLDVRLTGPNAIRGTDSIATHQFHAHGEVPLGARTLEVFRPEIRLLQTHWVHDAGTRTLFTSDMFTHARAGGPHEPPVVTSRNDSATAASVEKHLLGGRYWWLAQSHPAELRRWIASVFATREIETVAPAYGAILRGRDVIDRHLRLLDEAIANGAAA